MWQAYVSVRYFMRKKSLPTYRKWEMIAELLDKLEEDYLKEYPDENPVFEKGFKEALRKMVMKNEE